MSPSSTTHIQDVVRTSAIHFMDLDPEQPLSLQYYRGSKVGDLAPYFEPLAKLDGSPMARNKPTINGAYIRPEDISRLSVSDLCQILHAFPDSRVYKNEPYWDPDAKTSGGPSVVLTAMGGLTGLSIHTTSSDIDHRSKILTPHKIEDHVNDETMQAIYQNGLAIAVSHNDPAQVSPRRRFLARLIAPKLVTVGLTALVGCISFGFMAATTGPIALAWLLVPVALYGSMKAANHFIIAPPKNGTVDCIESDFQMGLHKASSYDVLPRPAPVNTATISNHDPSPKEVPQMRVGPTDVVAISQHHAPPQSTVLLETVDTEQQSAARRPWHQNVFGGLRL